MDSRCVFAPSSATSSDSQSSIPIRAIVIAKAGNQPVAILNRNEAIGYFVPKSAVTEITAVEASNQQVTEFLQNKLPKIEHVLDYLKDK